MSTVSYVCGCSVSTSVFGAREVLAYHLCQQHYYIYSQDKTPRQMAEEIREETSQLCQICQQYHEHKHG